MFDHLDDPRPFEVSEQFRATVAQRGRAMRHRRQAMRAAGTCGTALAFGAALTIARINPSGPPEATRVTEPGRATPLTTSTSRATIEVTSTAPPASADILEAQNVLIVGTDSRACIDPNSPFAAAFGSAADVAGERGDTIMVARINPGEQRFDLLSFPRDLWVKIDGRTGKGRINGAIDANNPSKLINTIAANFSVPIDHWVSIDFCAFKEIVDVVGGIEIPFEFAVRDTNTGLSIEGPECHTFGGEEALAYVRSRHFQWFDPASGQWQTDGTSDAGRVSRQQDFVKRMLLKALVEAADSPVVAKKFVDAVLRHVVTDSNVTVEQMMAWSTAVGSEAITGARSFQIEATGRLINNQSVLMPALDSAYMKGVLDIFRGQEAASEPVEPQPSVGVAPMQIGTTGTATADATQCGTDD